MKRIVRSCGATLAAIVLVGSSLGQPKTQPAGNGEVKPEDPNNWIVAARLRFVDDGKRPVVAFSWDGKVLATAIREDQTVHLWDVTSTKQICRLFDAEAVITALAFSPDGKCLASSSYVKIDLWDVGSRKRPHTIEGARLLGAVAFSPDGRSLASGNQEGKVELFELVTRRKRATTRCAPNIEWVCFSPNGKALVAGSWNVKVPLLWELWPSKEPHSTLMSVQSTLYSACFSPDGSTLAFGGEHGTISLRELATGKELRQLQGPSTAVWKVAFSPDGKILASGHGDGRVLLWDPATGRRSTRVLMTSGAVIALSFLPDGKSFAVACKDGSMWIWSRDPQKWEKLLWHSLGNDDPAVAYQNARALAEDPQRAVPYLRKHLRPVPPLAPGKISQLIAELDSEQFPARQKAVEELEKLGELAAPALRQLLQNKPSLEVCRRAEPLLQKIEKSEPSPDQLRGLRAVEVLEQIGTQEAREVIERLTKGAEGARLTQEAKTSLERMARLPRSED